MNIPLIEFQNVTKRFGGNTVLDQANLRIYEDQISTIIGKSGSGKSVLLKLIAGLLTADDGEILFEGVPLERLQKTGKWDRYRSHISYMFQSNALFDAMTVLDNVAFPLRYASGLGESAITERAMAQLKRTELSDAANRYPSELSGGMQKRAALARALVTQPKIVLFDEPTTGQDMIRRNVILSMISQHKKKLGFTAILVSHDIPDVLFISDRILILWEGSIAFQGTYEEATHLDHPLIDEFLKSIEGFQDELTGLLSKQMFRSRYSMTFGRDDNDLKGTAVLFGVSYDLLAENLGHRKAIDIVKAIGESINRYLGAIGGFSARSRRGLVLTIIPHTNAEEAGQAVDAMVKEIQDRSFSAIGLMTQEDASEDTCFEIYLSAGIIEFRSNDDMEQIEKEAYKVRKTIAVYRCEKGASE